MIQAMGNILDPPDQQFSRLLALEAGGMITLRGISGWRNPIERSGYNLPNALKIVFSIYFSRLYKYSLRGFKIMVGTVEWTT